MAKRNDARHLRSFREEQSRCGGVFPGARIQRRALPAGRNRWLGAGSRSEDAALSAGMIMSSELEKKVAELLQNPKNMGELESADAVGTVGNAGCGEML